MQESDKKHRKLRNWLLVLGIIVIAGAVILMFRSSRPVSQQDANTMCQTLYEEMMANIRAVPGYTIMNSKQSCNPTTPDEMGNTDYGFEAIYRLSKPGSDTVPGIKANMELLTKELPKKHFTVWVRNDTAPNGRPDTFCLQATTLIQGEYREVYNSFVENISDYKEPGTLADLDPCGGLD